MSEQLPPLASDEAPLDEAPLDKVPSHPVRLVVTDDLRRSRLTVFFRLLLSIPHIVVLVLWAIPVYLLIVWAWIFAVILGRVPSPLHRFFSAYLRYAIRVTAYIYLIADPFPPFGAGMTYPVDLEIPAQGKLNRLTVFFRGLIVIPALIILYPLNWLANILAFFGWFYALGTGRHTKGMRDTLAFWLRYQGQTNAYLLLLTRKYPNLSND